MLKKLGLLVLAALFVFSVSACGKQEQAEQQGAAPGMGEDLAIPQKGEEAVVDVPPDVKGKWKAIKIMVEKKSDSSTKEYTVALGESKEIPGSSLTIKAVEFLPSFVMQGLNITSASNEADNPAAKIVVTEGGQDIFKGWLFQKFPTTHAFSHPEYSITLIEGMPS